MGDPVGDGTAASEAGSGWEQMGSWEGAAAEGAGAAGPCELPGEAGVLASGRAMGCDRMGERRAF